MLKKNDKIILDITDMTSEGLGVAKYESQVYFVKDAVIDDRVEAIITKLKDNISFAKAISVIKKSIYRVESKCPVAMPCGGCQVMNLSYEKQLLMKENTMKNNLKRLAGLSCEKVDSIYEGIVGMDNPYYYRNKVQIPFAYENDKVVAGFYAGRTHHIVKNDMCFVSFKESSLIIDEVKKYLEKHRELMIYDELTHKGILRELMLRKANNTDDISVTFIVNDKKKDKTLYMPLVETLIKISKNIKTITININTDTNNVLFGKENIVLYGDGYIEDEILGFKFHISPESFYQINNVQTEKLYMILCDFISDAIKEKNVCIETALDLYCGIGTTTLMLTKVAKKIVGLEIVKKAIINAKENARINNISNAHFICANASDVKEKVKDYENFDLISVDPPRKGLDINAIAFIKEKAPKYLLYISCDTATLSRDIKLIGDMYDVRKVKCVDMFPHTMHIETVCLMEKK